MTGPSLDRDVGRTDTASAPEPDPPTTGRRPTRIGNLHAGLIIAAVLLVLLVVFLAQNSRAVSISFLGAHGQVSLAIALLMAAVAGALIVGAAGAARITQLRLHARRAARHGDTAR